MLRYADMIGNTMNSQCFGDVGGSGYKFGGHLGPRKEPPTYANTFVLNGFAMGRQSCVATFRCTHVVALTQNIMNSHVLAYVGDVVWVPK